MKTRPGKSVHPGGILRRMCVEPLSLRVTELAKILGVSRKTTSKLLNERGSITSDMALRLSRAFDTTPELWMNLQTRYDLWVAANSHDEWKSVQPIPKAVNG